MQDAFTFDLAALQRILDAAGNFRPHRLHRCIPEVTIGPKVLASVTDGSNNPVSDEIVRLVADYLLTRLDGTVLAPFEAEQVAREALSVAQLASDGASIDRERVCQVAAGAAQDRRAVVSVDRFTTDDIEPGDELIASYTVDERGLPQMVSVKLIKQPRTNQ